MISFKVLKKSVKSRARLGVIKTPHGEMETPCLVPVATQAVIKTLTSDQVKRTKSQLLISNTFHLHLKPGEAWVKKAGGLHKYMNWQGGLMTDSGGFQVFSLGFGRDHQVSKISSRNAAEVQIGQQPKLLKITEEGVHFTSYIDGTKLFLGPKESIKIQEDLGADIIYAFDECTPPNANYEYTRESVERTHRWAKKCLLVKKSRQALYGIVQGGRFKDLRQLSARYISGLPFDGFGIGGEFGSEKKTMHQMLSWVMAELPENKPRHLLGIGFTEDIPNIIKAGIDTFDCIVPTNQARHGMAFTSQGKLDLNKTKFLKDQKPLDSKCGCEVCGSYRRGYISHLIRAKEITGLSLLTFHNLYFFNSLVENYRKMIKREKL